MIDRTGKKLSSNEVMQKAAARFIKILDELAVYILHIVGCIPSHTVRRFFYRVGGMKIGSGSAIHMHARFHFPPGISIGEDTIIGENVILDGRNKLNIGNHVAFATGVMIYNSHHDIRDEHFSPISKPVTVGNYVFIGPRAIIMPGVTIGDGAVVGGGAVVTKDVKPFTIVAGVPAQEISKRPLSNPHYKIGRAEWFR